MNKHIHSGFTLVEMLVGLALLGIILTAIMSFFLSGMKSSTRSGATARLQQDTLTIQQFITGRLKEAWYVYPAGQTLTLNGSTAGFQQNPTAPRLGTNKWLTGTDPILALVMLPMTPGLACSTTAPAGCYQFIAYYPVQRATWVGAAVDAGGQATANNPGDDPLNASTWVMAEYRSYLVGYDPSTIKTTVPPITLAGSANLLGDYVAPTVVTPNLTTTSNIYTMFAFAATNGLTTTANNPVSGVTFRFASVRQAASTLIRTPDLNTTYQVNIFPDNLMKTVSP